MFGSIELSGLKRQENNTADARKETQCLYLRRYMRAKGQKAKMAARMEVTGSRQNEGCKSVDEGLEDERGGKSAKVALLFLYGFLDAQKHGGEPLVQSGNGVVFLHLRHE